MTKLRFSTLLISCLIVSVSFAAPPQKKKVKAQARAAPVAAPGKKGAQLNTPNSRSAVALPSSAKLQAPEKKTISAVKPMKTNDFYDASAKEQQYEHLLDEEIKGLYALSLRSKTSPNRGELWLRLAERYIEKASILDRRAQMDYENKLKDYLSKKTTVKPVFNPNLARDYNRKAIQLNEWFVQDFPQDPKLDQAYFFLGYNYFELGNTQMGEKYYQRLVQERPNSIFVSESNFALAEFYFDKDQWKEALDNYAKVIQKKNPRLLAFARYKAAWCLFRLRRVPQAMQVLEQVVRMSRTGGPEGRDGGRKSINKVRLGAEAIKDYVPFFAEQSDYHGAWAEFERIAGQERLVKAMMERLAYIYVDTGNRPGAEFTFRKLIASNPHAEKAAEYQYQIVLTRAVGKTSEFRAELATWLEHYGPTSDWAKANAKNTKLIGDVATLQETTVRNHVLQLHQGAQTSRAPTAQAEAMAAYGLYLKYFSNTPKAPEMQFFYAELLFDMNRYVDASRFYQAVADAQPKSQYRDKAVINAVLALEKDLPKEKELTDMRGTKTEVIPLDPRVVRFEVAAKRYLQEFPKGDKALAVQRIMGALYLAYNHHPEAQVYFEKIIKEHPGTQEADIAGDLLLDSYQRDKDAVGMVTKGQELLANPQVANTKLGARLRDVMERASYLRAEAIMSKEPSKGAKEFEDFANRYKNSQHSFAARYRAAVAYEKAGDYGSSLRLHTLVASSAASTKDAQKMQADSRNSLSRLYQKTGRFEEAAKQYRAFAVANRDNAQGANGYYNAAVLYEALGDYGLAHNNYDEYFKLSKKSDRFDVIFRQAEMYRRAGALSRAAVKYEEYLNKIPTRPVKIVEAAHNIAEIHQRQNHRTVEKTWRKRVLELAKGHGKAATARFTSEAQFELDRDVMDEIRQVRFTSAEKQQGESVKRVLEIKKKYINLMGKVIQYDNGPMIVAALASTGQMLDLIAWTYSKIPVPKGYDAKDAEEFKALIGKQIAGIREEAKVAYKSAVDRGSSFEYYGDWMKKARDGLRQVDPTFASKDSGEMHAESRLTDWMGL